MSIYKIIPDSGIAKAIEKELDIPDPVKVKAMEVLNEEAKPKTK